MKLKLLFLLLLTFLAIESIQAQSFECRVENESFPSSTTYEFDVKLYAKAPTTSWEYASGVYYINMNSAFRNAGTITASIVAGTSDLVAAQVPTAVTYNATNNYATIAAKTPPGAGAGTIIDQNGKRVIRLRLTNTVNYSTTAAPNLTWRWATPNSYVSAYIAGVNTPIVSNTVTAGQSSCKTPNYWTGSSWNKGLPLDTTDAVIFSGNYFNSLRVRSLVIAPNGTYNLADSAQLQVYRSINNFGVLNFALKTNIGNYGSASLESSGSAILSGTNYLAIGSTQRIVFNPNPGYVVDSVIVNGFKVDSINGYTFNNISSNNSLKVVFKPGRSTVDISSTHPQSGFFNTNSTNNIIASFQLTDSLSYSILSALRFSTQGNYTSADIQSMGFKCWINSTNDLVGATQIGSGQAVVTTGGIINFASLNQIIPTGNSYILVTCDISNMATNGNTIGLASTPLSNFVFSGATTTVTGFTTLLASNLFTINEMGPVKMQYTANNMYKEDFSEIANWTNGFTSGLGVGRWSAVNANSGTIPNATAITVSSANFQTSSSSAGIQRGSLTGNVAGTLAFLTLGNSDNTSSCAVDFSMDFSKRNADSLIFDAATVFNGVGNRNSTLRIYGSIDGVSFTELTGTNLPFVATNNVAYSATVRVKLPTSFNNGSTCRIRFYYHNGTGGTSSSRPKISIDNVQVSAICPVGTSTTNINSCTPYTWNGQTYNSSGVYYKTFTGASAWGCDSIASLNLNINSISSFNPFQDTLKACGSSYTLNAGNGYSTYLWNTGATTSTLSPTIAGKYKVTVSNGTCSATDSVLLSLVSANITNNDTTICFGKSITLSALGSGIISSSLNYLWSNSSNTQNITVNPLQTTTFYCTVSNGINSCIDSVKVIKDNFNPNLFIVDTLKVCGTSYTLNAGSGFTSYLWNTGSTSQNLNVTSAGWKNCTVSNGLCSSKDSILLSLVSANIFNNDTIINAGASVILKSTGTGVVQNPLTYLWSNGANTQNITVSPTQNTTYFCTVSNGLNACKDSVKIGVNVKINLKMFFEALYENGRLKSSLNNADGVSNMGICDTVQILLFDSINYTNVFRIKTLVDTAGLCQIYIPSALSNNKYYLVVKHRGSIETWSNTTVLITNGITYNFTNAISKAYGDNLKNDGNGVFLIYSGDINQDGFVDGNDFIDVDNDNAFFVSGYTDTDVNGDGFVDGNDFIVIDNNNASFIGFVRP